ncbi:Replication protein A 70 kDa DNA-binding subunit B [Abeliophyllum distichum]|uniref:Replication protein A 70 kDa DNA-binding subunit B n=1 Tax=Abeliophyllum distichum TaxID=126358 RepID=A0ABD1SG34_9LAMI
MFMQSPFGMSHQQALAHVTAQAALSQSFMHMQAEFQRSSSTTSAETIAHHSSSEPSESLQNQIISLPPEQTTSKVGHSEVSLSERKASSVAVNKPTNDGYNWRKYGQKQSKIRYQNMGEDYKLIAAITPNTTNWTAKVVVLEKSSARTAYHSPTKYQNVVLMDMERNKVQATIYDTNIQAFQDQLLPSKTYLISNAAVRLTKPEYRSTVGEIQWTISGRTKVQELQEDHTAFISSTYVFTPFDRLHEHMDSKTDISIIGVAIDIKPKRFIHTRSGTQSCIQDVVLVNQRFETVLLTMWDQFVEKECIYISDNFNKKPIIVASHLKVSSFSGVSISTKSNSTFSFNPPIEQATQLHNWVQENNEQLSQVFMKKDYLSTKPTKLSSPGKEQITDIRNIQGLLVVQHHFWVEARAYVRVFNQSFWYMACDICNKISSASFGETYTCIFCKSPNARAAARAQVFVELEDSTASINGTMIGEPAERMLQCSAYRLMTLTSPANQLQVLDEACITVEENHFFYLKAVKKDGHTDQWKYDIIFMLEPSTTRENVQPVNHPEHSSSTSQTINFVPQLMPPPAKRVLFEVPPTSASNKRLTEETLLHSNAETAVPKLSAIATPAMKNKEKVPGSK